MRRLLAVLLAVLPAVALSDDRRELAALFPDEADVFVEGGGLARLELPLPVLRACDADRADLRLFDRDGREVAFLVDDAPRITQIVREEKRIPAEVLDVRRDVIERRNAPAREREAFDVTVPPATRAAGTWGLELGSDAPEFVRKISVRTPEGESLLAASVFRLADGREKRVLPLPPLPGERVTIELEGEDGRFLTPTLTFVSSRDIAPPPAAGVSLGIDSMDSTGGLTAIVAQLLSIAPAAVRIETRTPLFDRRVRIFEMRDDGQRRQVGGGRIFRVGPGAEERDVPISGAASGRLLIEIDDQDSPPLADVSISALGRLPSIIFELPAAAPGTAAGVLRFGGERARRPHYDVAALVHESSGEKPAALADALALLARRTDLTRAWLGPVRANPLYDRTPALAFAMHPGAPLEASGFQYRRALRVRPSPDGLGRLRLDPIDVAHARADLGDLRVTDGEGRQWAYLLDDDAGETTVRLVVAPPYREGTTSSYALALAAPGAYLRGVVLDVENAFFDRPYRLVADAGSERERTLARGRLARAAGRSEPIAIAFAPTLASALTLEVDDGDDAPLALAGAEARAPVPDLFLAAPAGDYTLLFGNPSAEAPRYELSSVRDVVLALDGATIDAGLLEPNPGHRAPSPLADGPERTTVILWIVLGVAVVVLLVTTLRLAGGQRTSAR